MSDKEPTNIYVEFSSPVIQVDLSHQTNIYAKVEKSTPTINANISPKNLITTNIKTAVTDLGEADVKQIVENYISTHGTAVDVIEDGNLSPVSSNAVYDALQEIKTQMGSMSFIEIEIKSFTCSPSIAEIGSTQTVALAWELNKTPTYLSITGETIQKYSKSGSISLTVKTDRSWNLIAKDSESSVDKSTSIKFGLNNYYGIGETQTRLNQSFITGLSNSLQTNKTKTFTVNADTDEYIWYAYPSKYGTATFSVGGFVGGFVYVGALDITNSYDYEEEYYVYRSVNSKLGETTITVN